MILEILIFSVLVFVAFITYRYLIEFIVEHWSRCDLWDEDQELTEDEILFIYE